MHYIGNYCWRGTKSGVDLNRNFDWNFGASHGSSRDPNDEEYRGAHAFSGAFLCEFGYHVGENKDLMTIRMFF